MLPYVGFLALLVAGVPYYLIRGDKLSVLHWREPLIALGYWLIAVIFGGLIIGMVIHEWLHGISWAMFAEGGWRTIRYGFVWKQLTPYCHCKDPLRLRHYLIGAFLPALVMRL